MRTSIAKIESSPAGEALLQRERLERLLLRGAALNLSAARLCRAAQVAYPTVQRWREGAVDPGLKKYLDAVGRLETALAVEEKRLRAVLEIANARG